MTTATAAKKTDAPTAIDVAARCQLRPAARELLVPEQSCSEFTACLVAAEKFDDAIRFWAAALPRRQAIWWGALCAWEAYREGPTPAVDAAFRCVIEWIEEPTDERRRAAAERVKPVGAATPAGILLQALYYSGGSIAPAELPKFVPDERLFTKLLAEAVLLAGKQRAATKSAEHRAEFIATAEKIAAEKLTWQRNQPTPA